MEAIYLLIPLSLIALMVAIAIFVRMNGSGQFEETESAAWSVVMDDDRPKNSLQSDLSD